MTQTDGKSDGGAMPDLIKITEEALRRVCGFKKGPDHHQLPVVTVAVITDRAEVLNMRAWQLACTGLLSGIIGNQENIIPLGVHMYILFCADVFRG